MTVCINSEKLLLLPLLLSRVMAAGANPAQLHLMHQLYSLV